MAFPVLREHPNLLSLALKLAVICICQCQSGGGNLVVPTTTGRVRGVLNNEQGLKSVSFLGIPYAEPPVNATRFKPATPTRGWDGVLDTTEFKSACMQYIDNLFPGFRGAEMWNSRNQSEDCLTVNIWTPAPLRRDRGLAVMVWIYGGGFYSGAASLDVYDGSILSAHENVVVASFNYRVSMFGFLAFGTKEAPGNVGLLDQNLALQWIHDNIANFGGDPQRVTLFGESAGGASVSYHIVSELSRNLFQRAIMQSGSLFSPWAMISEGEAIRRGLELSRRVGCVSNDTDVTKVPLDNELNDIASCLRRKSPKELLDAEWVIEVCFTFPFVPVVDGSFLIESPEETIRKGKAKQVDILAGVTKNEGSFFMPYSLNGFSKDTESLINRTIFEKSISEAMPSLNSFGRDAVSFMYTNWLDKDNNISLRDNMEQAVGDYNVKCGLYRFAKEISEAGNNVHLYSFEQRAANNPWAEWMGVLHGDEIMYVFGDPLRQGKGYSEGDRMVSLQMMRQWANFAKTGNPNNRTMTGEVAEDWTKFTTTNQNVLRIKEGYTSSAKMEIWDKADICAFWNEYLPHLNTQTADIDDAEKKWKEEFHQWSTKYMVDWKAEFNHYIYNKKENNCGGG